MLSSFTNFDYVGICDRCESQSCMLNRAEYAIDVNPKVVC